MTLKLDVSSISHAYIIEAPWSFDKAGYAYEFAKAILCESKTGQACNECLSCKKINERNHVDIFFVEATKKKGSKLASLKDEDVENVQRELARSPVDSDRKIAIVKDADTMSSKAANRFLKTLEEPAAGRVIMLLSENINNLLPTIQSRCIHIRLNESDVKEQGKVAEDARRMVEMLVASKGYHELKKEIEDYAKDRTEAYSLIDAMEEEWMKSIEKNALSEERKLAYRGVDLLEDAREEIRRGNNASYALKKMILTVGGK